MPYLRRAIGLPLLAMLRRGGYVCVCVFSPVVVADRAQRCWGSHDLAI